MHMCHSSSMGLRWSQQGFRITARLCVRLCKGYSASPVFLSDARPCTAPRVSLNVSSSIWPPGRQMPLHKPTNHIVAWAGSPGAPSSRYQASYTHTHMPPRSKPSLQGRALDTCSGERQRGHICSCGHLRPAACSPVQLWLMRQSEGEGPQTTGAPRLHRSTHMHTFTAPAAWFIQTESEYGAIILLSWKY